MATLYHNGGIACDCDITGSISELCNPAGGQCPCKPGVGGQNCDVCLPGFYNLTVNGCQGKTIMTLILERRTGSKLEPCLIDFSLLIKPTVMDLLKRFLCFKNETNARATKTFECVKIGHKINKN